MMGAFEDIPLGGRFKINGTTYEYDIISRENERLHFSANGEALAEISYSETPNEFKDYLATSAHDAATIDKLERHVKCHIPRAQRAAYIEAWSLLHRGGNAFFKSCIGLLVDYHALDLALIQLQLRGVIRARYSSVSALLHFDCTGGPGAGKNDLTSNLAACIPTRFSILLSSVTPKALYYKLIERAGRGVTNVNKDYFKGKIVIITEVAEAETVTALKALAETDEHSEFTHSAVINGKTVDMTIRGPRCVITASVDGINDTQLKRRFIHGSVADETEDALEEKLELVEELLFENRNIMDDPRLPVIHAGFDILCATDDMEFRTVQREAYDLIKTLNRVFSDAGYGITNIKQFFTLCQCAAVWKRFARGLTRIEVEDVCEAWWLFSNVERETITKTSKNGMSMLRTIKELSEQYDEEAELEAIKYSGQKISTRSEATNARRHRKSV